MADKRFYRRAGPFTVADLASLCGASLAKGTDADLRIEDVAPIEVAQASHISFLDNRKYVEAFMASRAGACIIHPDVEDKAPAGMGLLLTGEPYHAYARVAAAFYPKGPDQTGISPAAVIDASALIGPNVTIEAGAVIGSDVAIGARSVVGANAVLHRGVVIGDDTVIGSNVTVSHAVIGNRVIVFPGVRIGQDGFGYAMGAGGHLKVPQLGRVMIEDDVEIGANSTIDRGAGPDTVIGAGTKIDNLVQIGHNVEVGRGCIIVSQVGISGSTHLGDFVVLGGQAGVTGHLRIGSGARIGAQSGIMRDVAAGATMGGSPAVTMTQWLRQTAELARLVRKKNR